MAVTQPYGDIFSVQTPSLDRLNMQLYQDQRQREQRAYDESQNLDRLLQSEVGKIRSADTPEFIGQYEKYKNIKKQLYNPKIQRSASEIAKINQDANIELAKAMQLANDSVETKDRLRQIASERKTKYDYFVDNFNSLYESLNNTPSSKIKPEDYDSLYYKGNVTNLQPVFDKARGQLKQIGEPEINNDFSPIEREVTTYKGYNSPRNYYNAIVGSLRGSRAQQDLINSFNFTPDEVKQIEEKYNNEVKNNPKFQKAYGNDALDFPESSDYSDVGRITKLLAMEHGLQALQEEKKRETKKQESALQRQGFSQSNIRLNAELQGKGANNDNPPPPKDETGENYDLTERLQGVKVSSIAGSALSPKPNTKITYNPTTKEVTYTEINGAKRTKPFSEFKKDISTINTAQDLKIVDQVINSIENPESKKVNKTYNFNGKTYTHAQIEKAAKQNNVSVEAYLKATGIK